jgi:hypothetical protein
MFARRLTPLVPIAFATLATSACVNPLSALPKLIEARRLASELQVTFTQASDAANLAVMADTDEASTAAKNEATRARRVVTRDVASLRPLLTELAYDDELHYLDGFVSRFAEYQRLDDEILPLAVENTNLKAQRLSFGAAQEAAQAFDSALTAAVKLASPGQRCSAELLAARARLSLMRIQVLQAPHIAASDDAAMTRMETEMKSAGDTARAALASLKGALPKSAAATLTDADAAFARFAGTNADIVALSRRNTNVRSLALSLGRKRTVVAECQDQLAGLMLALAKHESRATR